MNSGSPGQQELFAQFIDKPTKRRMAAALKPYQDKDTLAHLLLTSTDAEIGRQFGITGEAVGHWRRRFGLEPCARPLRGNRLFDFDLRFFASIDTPDKAYALGFITADGSIHKNGKGISIALHIADRAHLENIAATMGLAAPVHEKARIGKQPQVALNICGRALVRDLAALGVSHAKSATVDYPAIDPALDRHYIRGVFDGDGHVGKRQFSVTGNLLILSGIRNAIMRHTGCCLHSSIGVRWPRIVGSRRDRAVLTWLYEDAALALERKRENYLRWWQAP